MTTEPYTVVLFHTSNHAFHAEMVLKKADIPCKLIPVPRHLSSDCGVCARVAAAQKSTVAALLERSKVTVAGLHDL